jgi:hypothetical protein
VGSHRTPLGEWLAVAGAAVLFGSLFLPWYEFTLPAGLLEQGQAATPSMGEFGSLLQAGFAELARAGGVPLTGWQALDSLDVVLAGAAALVVAGVALNATGALAARPDGAIALIGLLAGGLVLYRMAAPPLAEFLEGEDLLSPKQGFHAALLGTALIVGGGVWARGDRPEPSAAEVAPAWRGAA